MIETSKATWKQAKFSGVEYIPLHMDLPERVGSMIVKMTPNASYPKHRHTQAEEIFVLKGSLQVGDQLLKGGDFLFSPQGTVHEMSTTEGCLFYMQIPAGLEFVSQSTFEDMDEIADTPAEPSLVTNDA